MTAVAFICAMPMELAPVRKMLGLRKQTVAGIELYSGTVAGKAAVAIVTGMGTKLAADATERLLGAVAVGRVVNPGITGALENDTPIGTLIVPETVVDGGSGAEYTPAPLGGHVPHGKMHTGDTLITGAADLARLRADGFVSLDMETAAIARVCEARAIPWSVFRVISDRASDGSVDEEVFRMSNPDGSPNPVAVAKYFATHPGRLPAMLRLARGATSAAKKAAEIAIAAVASA